MWHPKSQDDEQVLSSQMLSFISYVLTQNALIKRKL